ncbi:hypothetical protein KCG53_03125 [Neisseria subflava]|uniref:PurT C-terminal domain-containing protein n=1 Tax=Neisseria subflava TaxID=28449 RepID=A0A9X9N773_NEISU|nr:hypothetical protein KCG53_03125 [Neisseria subflava]
MVFQTASKPRLKASKPLPIIPPTEQYPRHLPRFGALRFVRTVAECRHHADAVFARVDYTNAGFRFNSNICIFGKGEVNGHRCLGVLFACDISIEKALEKVERAYAKLDVKL